MMELTLIVPLEKAYSDSARASALAARRAKKSGASDTQARAAGRKAQAAVRQGADVAHAVQAATGKFTGLRQKIREKAAREVKSGRAASQKGREMAIVQEMQQMKRIRAKQARGEPLSKEIGGPEHERRKMKVRRAAGAKTSDTVSAQEFNRRSSNAEVRSARVVARQARQAAKAGDHEKAAHLRRTSRDLLLAAARGRIRLERNQRSAEKAGKKVEGPRVRVSARQKRRVKASRADIARGGSGRI